METIERPGAASTRLPPPLRAALVVALLYLFLAGVRLLEVGIRGLGSDYTDALFENVANPVSGLCVGILATVLVQSSSVTTATIVGLVASGVITVDMAVPMIMGANIGTTVTNTIVAMGHMRRTDEFRRALTAATMHDAFNIMTVAILFPLEVATGAISSAAQALTSLVSGGQSLGGSFQSPIKGAVDWLGDIIENLLGALTNSPTVLAVLTLVVGIALIFTTLALITKNMRVLVAARIERSLNAALARSGIVGMVVGIIVTVAVQSSSITTSILIPLVASGVIVVRHAYPITLGANIGTTITALLAALGAGAIDGLTIALTHTLFNVAGILLFYSVRWFRDYPIRLAEALTGLAVGHKTLAVAALACVFVVIPAVGIVVL